MTTIDGLYAIGEANFSDHGANRLGASALMQGLADGYFILPYTIGDYLAQDEVARSEEHTSELQSRSDLVCRLLLEKKNQHSANPASPRQPRYESPHLRYTLVNPDAHGVG